ncbi:MAG: glycosyltransferase family 9 protein [Bryobacteraceae bacterium]
MSWFWAGFAILALVRRLIIRSGGIGDFIVSLPAMECLRADYLEVWTASAHVPLVQFADAARSMTGTGIDLLGIRETGGLERLIGELRSFDSIVSWYGTGRQEFRDLVRKLGLPFRFFPALPPQGSRVHATDFYLEQARSIAPCECDGVPRIRCDGARGLSCEESKSATGGSRADQGVRPPQAEDYAVIHPFSGSARKNWPLEKFRGMAARLARVMPVRWCAGAEDPPLEGAVRIDDLWELARWLARARLYVGNDSGITHLAAAVGTPVLALFGASDPRVWSPRGENVRVAWWGGGR